MWSLINTHTYTKLQHKSTILYWYLVRLICDCEILRLSAEMSLKKRTKYTWPNGWMNSVLNLSYSDISIKEKLMRKNECPFGGPVKRYVRNCGRTDYFLGFFGYLGEYVHRIRRTNNDRMNRNWFGFNLDLKKKKNPVQGANELLWRHEIQYVNSVV